MNKKKLFDNDVEKRFLTAINIPYPYNRPKSLWIKSDKNKMIALPDPHEPYSSKIVYDSLENQHKNAGTIIVTGDLGDYYSKSRFKKTKKQPFSWECNSVFKRIEWLATHWERVLIMMGNHDNRPEKMIQGLLEIDVDLLMLTEQNLLEHFARYFDNVEVVGVQLNMLTMANTGLMENEPKILSHIYQHGDIIFTHREASSVNKFTLMQNLSQTVYRWSGLLGLKPYSVLAQSHNHTDLMTTVGVERWFLMPCAMEVRSTGGEYMFHPSMKGNPPSRGYAIFYQENGITDYNQSRNYII